MEFIELSARIEEMKENIKNLEELGPSDNYNLKNWCNGYIDACNDLLDLIHKDKNKWRY